MKEIDQEGKSVAVNSRIASLPYRVTVINQYAARCAREDFLEAIKKVVPEIFKDKESFNNCPLKITFEFSETNTKD